MFVICWGCGRNDPGQAQDKAEEGIHQTFMTFKRTVVQNDRARLLRQLSPSTLEMFNRIRDYGLDPGNSGWEDLSQMEILLGLQLRWVLGAEKLAEKTPAALLTWCIQNGIVQIRELMFVDVCKVEIQGAEATVLVQSGNTVLTNMPLTFSRHGRKWKLNLDRLLLATEPQLAEVRLQLGVTKPELAVGWLENKYQGSRLALRELLLPPQIREICEKLKTAAPEEIGAAVLAELSAGRQSAAESLLDIFVEYQPNDQGLALAQAICARSRWNLVDAARGFQRILALDPSTPEGNCARYALNIEARERVEDNMQALRLLASRHPDRSLFLWLLAIECRDYNRRTGQTTYTELAVQCYRRLLEIFEVGPVMVHHTFANVLAEEDHEYEAAMVHRRIAVELEPRGWSYQGMGNTLHSMDKYEEANAAFAKAVELDPREADYWYDWGRNLNDQGRYDDAIEKFKQVLACDPSHFKVYNSWGYALECQGKFAEALDKYRQAMAINPAHAYAYDASARVYLKLGNTARAQAMYARKANMEHGKTTAVDGSGTNAQVRASRQWELPKRATRLDENVYIEWIRKGRSQKAEPAAP